MGIIDEDGKRIWKKLRNDPGLICVTLRAFKEDISGIVVESTYKWYWLVDLLMGEGYRVHLANPSGVHQYSGLKHGDDGGDAFWLAEMVRLNILSEGYIYPKEQRPLRDSAKEARASGEAEDIAHCESSEYPSQGHRGKDECESYEGIED